MGAELITTHARYRLLRTLKKPIPEFLFQNSSRLRGVSSFQVYPYLRGCIYILCSLCDLWNSCDSEPYDIFIMMESEGWIRVHKMASIPLLIKDKLDVMYQTMSSEPFNEELMRVCCAPIVETLERIFPNLISSPFLESVADTVKSDEINQSLQFFQTSYMYTLE